MLIVLDSLWANTTHMNEILELVVFILSDEKESF